MKLKKQRWPLLAGSCVAGVLLLLLGAQPFGTPVFAEESLLSVEIPVKQTVSVTVGSMETDAEKEQSETAASQTEAEYILTAVNGAPLPEGAEEGSVSLTCAGNTDGSFEISYSASGEYVYTLKLGNVSPNAAELDEAPVVKSSPEAGQELTVRVYVKKEDGKLQLAKVLAYDEEGQKTDLSFEHSWSKPYRPPLDVPEVGGMGVFWFYIFGGLLIACAAGQWIRLKVYRG